MEAEHITDKVVKGLDPRDQRYAVRDLGSRNLLLRIEPSGRRSFHFVKKFDGRTRWKKLGDYPSLSVKRARAKARAYQTRIDEGENPFDKANHGDKLLFGKLWSVYYAEHALPNKKSALIDNIQYRKHLSRWKNRRLSTISKIDVKRLHSSIGKKKAPAGGPVCANRILALVSSMWSFGERELDVEIPNPTRGVKRSTERPRTRYLLPDELRRFWDALGASPQSDAHDIIKLLLLCAQRKGQICGLRWEQVDFHDEVLKFGAKDMKSGRRHILPLSPCVVEILRARRQNDTRKTGYVFRCHGVRGYVYDLRRPMAKLVERAEITENVTLHDLRRTWSSYCREIGRDAAPILAHTPQQITERHYALPTLEGMRATVRLVEAHLLVLASAEKPGQVVDFPQQQVK